jgi:hypothetical protein
MSLLGVRHAFEVTVGSSQRNPSVEAITHLRGEPTAPVAIARSPLAR